MITFSASTSEARDVGIIGARSLLTAVVSSGDVAASHPFKCCCVQRRHCTVFVFVVLARVVEYITPAAFYAAPVPVVEYIVTAPAVSYLFLTHVDNYIAPRAPCVAPSLVGKYIAPTGSYVTPSPVVEYTASTESYTGPALGAHLQSPAQLLRLLRSTRSS